MLHDVCELFARRQPVSLIRAMSTRPSTPRSPRVPSRLQGVACLVCLLPPALAAQESDDLEWSTYGGDLADTRYSPADQRSAGFGTDGVSRRCI